VIHTSLLHPGADCPDLRCYGASAQAERARTVYDRIDITVDRRELGQCGNEDPGRRPGR
jgi:hypothetical protein